MMNVIRQRPGAVALAFALVVASACSSSSSSPSSPVTTPTPGSSPVTNPTPTPSLPPVTGLGCPIGKGTTDTSCYKSGPKFLSQIESAIDQLAKEQPGIFNLNDQAGPGGYKVQDTSAYYAGVIRKLQDMGMCADLDALSELQVKDSNDFSEAWDVLISTGHVRRGPGAYRSSCYPASFPLDAQEAIAYVKISFYGYKCEPGITPPIFADKRLPMGCEGFITATPKDRNDKDVDERYFGTDIAWKLEEGKGVVDTEHHDGQPFNYTLVPLRTGGFSFCATVKGVKGCLNAEVMP